MIHLRSLLSVQPATSTGQVTAVWGEIEAGLSRGMKLREVWEAAKLAARGLRLSVPVAVAAQLWMTAYADAVAAKRRPGIEGMESPAHPAPPPPDPFSNLREQREKKNRSGFEYDPFSINRNLID